MELSGAPREAQEVTPEAGGRIRRRVGVEEQTAELFPRAEDLLTPVAQPAGIGGGHVEQLQGPLESALEPVRTPGVVRPDRAFHLASDVSELLDQLEPRPAPARRVLVNDSSHGQVIPAAAGSRRPHGCESGSVRRRRRVTGFPARGAR